MELNLIWKVHDIYFSMYSNYFKDNKWKRPLDTPKRMIERREREGEREKERYKERYREGGRDKRERERERWKG